MHDHAATVRCLCKREAWIEAPDHADDTPLLLAARMAGVETVTALLEAKADVRARNKLGMTALCEAAVVRERFDVAEVLVVGLYTLHAALFHAMSILYELNSVYSYFLQNVAFKWVNLYHYVVAMGGVNPAAERVNGGYTLMHAAAAMNKVEAVRWLLANGMGKTAAEGAAGKDAAKGTVAVFDKKQEAALKKPVPGGLTPLHGAAAAGAAAAAEVLLVGLYKLNPVDPIA
jgi:hypothetical protein